MEGNDIEFNRLYDFYYASMSSEQREKENKCLDGFGYPSLSDMKNGMKSYRPQLPSVDYVSSTNYKRTEP